MQFWVCSFIIHEYVKPSCGKYYPMGNCTLANPRTNSSHCLRPWFLHGHPRARNHLVSENKACQRDSSMSLMLRQRTGQQRVGRETSEWSWHTKGLGRLPCSLPHPCTEGSRSSRRGSFAKHLRWSLLQPPASFPALKPSRILKLACENTGPGQINLIS